MSTIVLSAIYGGSALSHQAHDTHTGYAAPVSPDQLGGAYEFTDTNGQRVTATDFEGQWTLLFFGYARCRGSCPVATPKIVKAAKNLRAQGINAQAVFVDIEAPPQHMVSRVTGQPRALGGHGHGDMNRIAAMRALASTWDGELRVLTGDRMQLANAARAFKVAREHTPPRNGEEGHSINHSSRIYFVGPDTKVAGYGYHDSDPAELVATVAKLNGTRGAG